MIRTRTWIIVIAAFFLLSAAAAVWLYVRPAPGTVANIYRDGEAVYSVDLSRVTESYEFTLTDARGSNVIRVEPGRIAVVSADCPDKVCVEAGWRSDSASPIVCLPHRLVIRVEKSAAGSGDLTPDAVSQ